MSMTAEFDYDVMPANGAVLVPAWSPVRSRLEAQVRMRASFSDDGEMCATAQYRQYVRGAFRVGGKAYPHLLCSSPMTWLSETQFHQDGCPGDGRAYGHRTVVSDRTNYRPGEAGGLDFLGADEPGIGGEVGETLDVDLYFIGRLVDVSGSGRLLAETHWRVQGRHTVQVPESHQSEAQMKTRDGDTVYAKVWRDTEADPWSGMLVVAHSAEHDAANGRNHETGIDLVLTAWGEGPGGEGRELALDGVVPVRTVGGGLARSSTTFFTLARTESPRQMTGLFNGKPFNLSLVPVKP